MNETIIRAITIAAIFCSGVATGWGFCSSHNSKLLADNAIRLQEKQKQVSEQADRIVKQYVDRIITKEVKVYVPSKDNTCHYLDGNFRMWHDSFTTGMSETTGSFNDLPISIEAASNTIGENYNGCQRNTAQLEALQAWTEMVSK